MNPTLRSYGSSPDTDTAYVASVEQALSRCVRRRRLDRSAAEEFRGDTWVRLIERRERILGGFRGESSFATYVTIVVERCFIDWCRKTAGERRLVSLDTMMEESPERVPASATPSQDAVAASSQAESLAGAMRAALALLSPEDRLLIRMRYVDALRVRDIAAMLCLPEKPLYRRYEQLLASLRQELVRQGVDAAEVLNKLGASQWDLDTAMALRQGASTGDVSPMGSDRGGDRLPAPAVGAKETA